VSEGGAPPAAELLTFLIADIRGYTSYIETHGDESGARLTEAFATAGRAAIETQGGRVLAQRGDELVAAFTSPRGALRAAVEFQSRCAAARRDDSDLPLHIGIGLDAGEAIRIGDDYRGGALNLAARLCANAKPGEVLASEAAVHLARRMERLTYSPAGPFTLKGYAAPVSAMRVSAIEDEEALPPRPEPPAARPRPRWLLPGAAAATVVIAAAVTLAVLQGNAPQHAGSGAPRATSTPAPAVLPAWAAAPAAMPRHLAVGLAAGYTDNVLTDWMPQSGVHWDFADLPITSPVPGQNGEDTSPVRYARAAAAHHYLPVFSTYFLGAGTETDASARLTDRAAMRTFFERFKTLFRQLGSRFGTVAIVHVEPNLSGFADEMATTESDCLIPSCAGNPRYVPVAVKSTGVPEVAGFRNTYWGLSWAIAHLRDLYAPHVLLAVHLSPWATGRDITTETSSVDANALGKAAGGFAEISATRGGPAHVRPYDLLFTDIGDEDAGYAQQVQHDSHLWWDSLNRTEPNFHRWESYVAAAGRAAGLAVVVWGIPRGNQVYLTENNTPYHYQDNKAEYLFGHTTELVRSGIIGLIFGPGVYKDTSMVDDSGDGVSNGSRMCIALGRSSGKTCTHKQSHVADDDGGYLRVTAAAYERHPTPLRASPAAR
jgi:class 3 adenylate cyclase